LLPFHLFYFTSIMVELQGSTVTANDIVLPI